MTIQRCSIICHSLYLPYTAISKEIIFLYSAYWLKRNFYAVYHFKRIVERAGLEPATCNLRISESVFVDSISLLIFDGESYSHLTFSQITETMLRMVHFTFKVPQINTALSNSCVYQFHHLSEKGITRTSQSGLCQLD